MRIALLMVSFLLPFTAFTQKYDQSILSIKNPTNCYVAIIANENYQDNIEEYQADVVHAILEGEGFKQRLITKYGVSKHNISTYNNANATQIKLLATKLAALSQRKGGVGELIFYYTGKYYVNGNQLYLLPSGVSAKELKYAVSIDYLITKLEYANALKVSILVDGEEVDKSREKSLLVGKWNLFPFKDSGLNNILEIKTASQKATYLFSNDIDVMHVEEQATEILLTNEDIQPPQLVINSPITSDSLTTTESMLHIQGQANDSSGIYIVSVNGQEAHINKNGQFRATINLILGVNRVYVQAIDINKNVALKELYINRILSEELQLKDTINRSVEIPETQTRPSYYALLIGVNNYSDPSMTNLDGPLNDVDKLHVILINQYSFNPENVTVLKDPSRQYIIQKLDELEQKLTVDDNLLVFFAGHGTWNDKVNKGYWLPSDAQIENTANWIRNSTISGYISGIQTKHTLLIADACFSGGIFKTRSISTSPESIQKVYQLSSRKAMTSGTLNEVPDKSIFIEYLTKTLIENPKKFISAEQLFYSLKPAVLNNSDNIPQFGVIKNAGDEGGDFIFIRK